MNPDQPGHDSRGARPDSEKFWARLGFASFQEYMTYLRKSQGLPKASARATVDLPPTARQVPLDAESPRPAQRQRRQVRQLGLKLSLDDYDNLVEAADAYGVTPTTLARMLVRRGVRAMLRADRGRE